MKSTSTNLEAAEVEDAFESCFGDTGASASFDESVGSWVVWEPEEGVYWLVNEAGDGEKSANGLGFARVG